MLLLVARELPFKFGSPTLESYCFRERCSGFPKLLRFGRSFQCLHECIDDAM